MAITINRTTSLDGAILPEYMPGLLYMNENQAHKFAITCTRGGSAVTLTGGITGRFMRADGQTILLSGSISSGKANLTLPQSCYIVPGRFTMAIFNVVGNAVTTIYALTGNVARTQTDTLVDPGNTVPTIDNLLAEIDAMRQATADAEAAATKAVRYDTSQSLTDANKATARDNINAAGLAQVVRHDASQNLTETQKTTARNNIEAAGIAQVVRHDAAQSLTETQKSTARGNIGAANELFVYSNRSAINDILYDVVDLSVADTDSLNGITFTYDRTNGEIVCSGTASSNVLLRVSDFFTGVSKITLSGGASGGDRNTYNIAVYDMPGGGRIGYSASSTPVDITLDPSKTYIVCIVIFSGQTLTNAVFTPHGYVSGRLLDLEKEVNVIKNSQTAIKHYYGLAFVCACGDTVIIDTKYFRIYNPMTGTYSELKTDTTKLTAGFSTPRYIDFDGTSFSLNTTVSPYTVAMVSNRYVTPMMDGVIANYRAIQDGYIRNNSKYCINYARTPMANAIGEYGSSVSAKVWDKAYEYTTEGIKSYDIGDRYYTFTLSANNVDIANKKILIIGDSFVQRGYIQNFLHGFENSLSFIGTKTTQNYNYKSEGVSGSRLYYFTDPDTSPFWFGSALNFGAYLSNNNLLAPDYVIINSAINHSAYNDSIHGSYLDNLKALVNMIHAYSSSIKIYVTFAPNYAILPPSTYGYPHNRWVEVRKCCNSVYDVPNVTIIPVDYTLIDELDYTFTSYDYYGETISVLSDCVHPKEESGFKKIAYMIYNYLGV